MKKQKDYAGNLTQFVPPGFMNLYTLRDMRNAHLSKNFVIEGLPQMNQRIVGLYSHTKPIE